MNEVMRMMGVMKMVGLGDTHAKAGREDKGAKGDRDDEGVSVIGVRSMIRVLRGGRVMG